MGRLVVPRGSLREDPSRETHGWTGLVRLRVKRASAELEKAFDSMTETSTRGSEGAAEPSPFSEITDEDIDALFSE